MAVAPFPAMLCRPLQMAARATVCAMRAAEPDQEDMMSRCRDPMADTMSAGMPSPPTTSRALVGLRKGDVEVGCQAHQRLQGDMPATPFHSLFPPLATRAEGRV